MRRRAMAGVAAALLAILSFATPAGASTTVKRIPGTAYVDGVSCPSVTVCWAAGSTSGRQPEGFVVKITKGVPGKLLRVAGAGQLVGISCWNASSCEASANDVGTVANDSTGGVFISKGKPKKPVKVAGVSVMEGISCSSATTCEMVGQGPDNSEGNNSAVVVAVKNGKPGKAVTAPHSSGAGVVLIGVSCVKATCTAVGSGIFQSGSSIATEAIVVRILGGKPAAPAFDAAGELDGVSCVAAASCEAVGVAPATEVGIVVALKSGHPGQAQVVPHSSWLYGLSCKSQSSCRGSGLKDTNSEGATVAVEFNVTKGKAARATTVGGASNLDSISCPTAAVCEAGGTNSNLVGSQTGVIARG